MIFNWLTKCVHIRINCNSFGLNYYDTFFFNMLEYCSSFACISFCHSVWMHSLFSHVSFCLWYFLCVWWMKRLVVVWIAYIIKSLIGYDCIKSLKNTMCQSNKWYKIFFSMFIVWSAWILHMSIDIPFMIKCWV